jgi:outer membrane murein-binding lipoprotein Lpp
MRRALALSLLLLAGCQPSFDDKFAETEAQLKADAERLDKDMAAEAAKEPGAE